MHLKLMQRTGKELRKRKEKYKSGQIIISARLFYTFTIHNIQISDCLKNVPYFIFTLCR